MERASASKKADRPARSSITAEESSAPHLHQGGRDDLKALRQRKWVQRRRARHLLRLRRQRLVGWENVRVGVVAGLGVEAGCDRSRIHDVRRVGDVWVVDRVPVRPRRTATGCTAGRGSGGCGSFRTCRETSRRRRSRGAPGRSCRSCPCSRRNTGCAWDPRTRRPLGSRVAAQAGPGGTQLLRRARRRRTLDRRAGGRRDWRGRASRAACQIAPVKARIPARAGTHSSP